MLETLVLRSLEVLDVGLSLAMVPYFAFLGLVTLAAVRGRRKRTASVIPDGSSPRLLFVIPAHNEELSIVRTVQSCRAVDYDPRRFDVLVVADNCTDATARLAREAGAQVVERSDPDRRGKGFALAFVLGKARAKRYDAFVVIDADSVVAPRFLSVVASEIADGADWVQGYGTVSNPDASWRTRLMTYSLSLCNGVWLLGEDRLRLGGGLRGNGMCLTARGLARFPWKAYGLVEDKEFSWMLRESGERIRFRPDAQVYSEMVTRGGPGASAQRKRWDAGRRSLPREHLIPLLRSQAIGPIQKLLSVLDLTFPSLIVLALMLVAASGVHPAALFVSRLAWLSSWLLPVHATMAAILAAYALSPIVVMGLPIRTLRSLAMIPYYAAWKLWVTAGRLPQAWVRTRRESEEADVEGRVDLDPTVGSEAPAAIDVGVVVIGRNEGDRLQRCLEAVIGERAHVVYVDSGSTDGSVELARSMGVDVVELDLSAPFTAARARNEGFARLPAGLEFVQFVDGDCEVIQNWLARAARELGSRSELAVVCGQLRERHPERSIYNRLADLEWDGPSGEIIQCGGIAMIRAQAFVEVGGFDPTLIAAEDDELCLRLRRAGWKLVRLDAEMAIHDMAMTRFGQWWTRSVRTGHAYAEGMSRHGRSPDRHFVRETRSIVFWGLIVPLIALGLASPTRGASLLALAGYPLLYLRIVRASRARGWGFREAGLYALFCVLGKVPQALGLLRFMARRIIRSPTKVIEYKSLGHGGRQAELPAKGSRVLSDSTALGLLGARGKTLS